mmetsp:Transcript_98455/g.303482  ORF Transcript_98455/g.303482 Transcript_98455/m.303482 type:complete len:221 (+) Transcript_98455:390-1052(+)
MVVCSWMQATPRSTTLTATRATPQVRRCRSIAFGNRGGRLSVARPRAGGARPPVRGASPRSQRMVGGSASAWPKRSTPANTGAAPSSASGPLGAAGLHVARPAAEGACNAHARRPSLRAMAARTAKAQIPRGRTATRSRALRIASGSCGVLGPAVRGPARGGTPRGTGGLQSRRSTVERTVQAHQCRTRPATRGLALCTANGARGAPGRTARRRAATAPQ